MIVPVHGRTVNSVLAVASTFAALFPVGDRSVQVRTIDPHSPETWRPNSRQVS
jgi:hypothetical protein